MVSGTDSLIRVAAPSSRWVTPKDRLKRRGRDAGHFTLRTSRDSVIPSRVRALNPTGRDGFGR
jgi:hypothetical protein